jgi:hypothetical protein
LHIVWGDELIIEKQIDGSLKIKADKNQIDILSLTGSLKTNLQLTNEALNVAISQSYVCSSSNESA